MPSFQAQELQEFAAALLHAGGATAEEANIVARSLVASNLRGYDSHGMMRVPFYVQMIDQGTIRVGAELTISTESPTHLVADANWGFGRVQTGKLLDLLIRKCEQSGMAIGTLVQCGHAGRLGEYCEIAAERNLVSMMMVNSHGAAVRMAPPGGRAPRLSTNPLAIGAPLDETPLLLDFSTSATAEGKVRVKQIAGESVPEGLLIDNRGHPTTDPGALYTDPPGAILPMGGLQAYKGFGLGLMIEILTGALSGGVTAREVPYPKKGNCVFLMLIDPDRFGGREHFASEVSQLVQYIRDCPKIDGVDRIILPGDPERDVLAQRTATGIELDEENWRQLVELAERLGVAVTN